MREASEAHGEQTAQPCWRVAKAHFLFLSVQQAAPGAFQVLNDCDDVCHAAELLLLLTTRECHTLLRVKGLPASYLRTQKPRHL